MVDNCKFTEIKVLRQGKFEINNAFIEMQFDTVALITVDCKTKYPEIFTHASADSISITSSQTFPDQSTDKILTTIGFPEFPGWDIHSYSTGRYSIYITLKKPIRKDTPEYLFDRITKIIAEPHTTITEHDQKRAAKILLAFHSYIGKHEQDQEDINCPYVNVGENFMFWYYLVKKFGEEWVDEIDKD